MNIFRTVILSGFDLMMSGYDKSAERNARHRDQPEARTLKRAMKESAINVVLLVVVTGIALWA